jgi:hypothetical protein
MRPEYYLIPVAVVAATVLTVALHLAWKPGSLGWEVYDPGVLYGLNNSLNGFAETSCGENTVTAFGGSLLLRAINARGGWWKWMDWNFYEEQIDRYLIRVITRQGKYTTFETLLPILEAMPHCKKTLLFQSHVFRPAPKMKSFSQSYDLYLYTAIFHARYLLEQLWPPGLRTSYHNQFMVKDPFRYETAPLVLDHWKRWLDPTVNRLRLGIIDEQIKRGATVIILAIARRSELEMAEKSEKEAYLNTLKILARKTPGLNILEFPVQDKEMYRDYLHLNAGGSDLFKQWLPGQLKMLELQ